MDATATVNEQNAEGELQANPDVHLISKPKADWSVRDFRDSIEELAGVEAADILLTGDAPVALLRKAGLVNDPTGPNPNAYSIDPRFNGLTTEDAQRMRQNAGKYAKALKSYRTSMKRISASGPVNVSYTIGGVNYSEDVHVSPSGEFAPTAYINAVADAPRNMALSVHSQNVWGVGKFPSLPNPEMLWDGVNTSSNRLMQGESQVIKLLEGQDTSSLAYVAAENQRTPSFVRRREPTGRPTDNLSSGIGDVNQSLFQSAIEDTDEWRNTEAMLKENATNFDAAGNPLAPNGQLSKLPYREWVTVRTPSFLNWFGDWMNDPENASKAVDENGEPKIVYHGTFAAPFTQFGEGAEEITAFFTSDPAVARTYAPARYTDNQLYPCFLNLRNPLEMAGEGIRYDAFDDTFLWGFEDDIEARDMSTDDIVQEAKEDEECDGVIFSNIIDTKFALSTDPVSDVYVAFYPEQIKSIDNRGTFSTESNDILYQPSNERIEALRERYAMPLEEREQWKGKLPADIFGVRKQQITDIFLEYPKVRLGNVAMLQGLDYGDMPFQKELIQTEMLQLILGEPVILLPRYADKTLNSILGTSLREGSIPDGIAITADSGKYVDYKAIGESNIIRRINKAASEGADMAFVAVDKLSGNWQARFTSPSSQLNVPDGFEAYIYNIADGSVHVARKNKGLAIESLAGGQEHDSRLRMLSSALIGYIQGPEAVKNGSISSLQNTSERIWTNLPSGRRVPSSERSSTKRLE